MARAVVDSPLVKCAIHGRDPNWGRILSAVGTSSATFEPDHIGVAINGVEVCRNGFGYGDPAAADLSGRQITVDDVARHELGTKVGLRIPLQRLHIFPATEAGIAA